MDKILPQKIKKDIKCSNPRCVTSIEKYVPNIFYLVNEEKGQYKCMYCDTLHKIKGE